MEDSHKRGTDMHGGRRGAMKHHPCHYMGKDHDGCKSEGTPKGSK
jgi:hypothetical protein